MKTFVRSRNEKLDILDNLFSLIVENRKKKILNRLILRRFFLSVSLTIGIRNEFFCKFYGFLSTHVLYSTLLITTIAFDRYFCICWPLYKIITIHRAHAIVIICGLLSSLLGILSFYCILCLVSIIHFCFSSYYTHE